MYIIYNTIVYNISYNSSIYNIFYIQSNNYVTDNNNCSENFKIQKVPCKIFHPSVRLRRDLKYCFVTSLIDTVDRLHQMSV